MRRENNIFAGLVALGALLYVALLWLLMINGFIWLVGGVK